MQEQKKTTRVPKCGYCANHGIKNPLKAHKRECKFLDCTCKLCVNTRLRREHMADMQYIKRNGIVELERIRNEIDVQVKKKEVYIRIYQERMANKNKKRNIKSGSGVADALLAETGSSAAISPNSSIGDPANNLPPQLTTLSEISYHSYLRALANASPYNKQSFTATYNQFLESTKNLFGINSTTASKMTNTQNAITSLTDHAVAPFFNKSKDIDLNEIAEILDRLHIENNLNEDEKVLSSAICILFNGSQSMNPGLVAEEIYTTFKQLCLNNMFR